MTYDNPVVWRREVLGQIIWLLKTHGFSQQGAGLYCAALEGFSSAVAGGGQVDVVPLLPWLPYLFGLCLAARYLVRALWG